MKIKKYQLFNLIKNNLSENLTSILKEEEDLSGARSTEEWGGDYPSIPADWYHEEGNGHSCHLAALEKGASPGSVDGNSVDIETIDACKKYRENYGFVFRDSMSEQIKKFNAEFIKADTGGRGGSLGKWYKLSRGDSGVSPGGDKDVVFKITAANESLDPDLNIIFAFNSSGDLTHGDDWVAYRLYESFGMSWGDSWNTQCRIQYKGVENMTYAYKNPEVYKDRKKGYGRHRGMLLSGQYDGAKVDDVPTAWAGSVTPEAQMKMAKTLMTIMRIANSDNTRDYQLDPLFGAVTYAINQYDHKMWYLKKSDRSPTDWRPLLARSVPSEEVIERRAATPFADLPGNLIGGFDLASNVAAPDKIHVITNKKFSLNPRVELVSW